MLSHPACHQFKIVQATPLVRLDHENDKTDCSLNLSLKYRFNKLTRKLAKTKLDGQTAYQVRIDFALASCLS